MRVVAYDPYLTLERAQALNVEKVQLDELLMQSDFITLHTPMTEKTRNIIDREALAQTKQGVRIVNCARGGLVNEADLKAAIEAGHVAGAALDVFEKEPAKENPLFGMDQVIVTPHLGASTHEAQENVALQVAEQIAAFLNDGAIVNAVNTVA
jgi:D-3-phosphoglycerate dehydrogenase